MGARGPLKIPMHLRPVADGEKAGTLAERVRQVAPDYPPGFPVGGELRELWDELVPTLDEAGLLARCDGLTLELALRHFVAARRAARAVEEQDVVVKDQAHGGVKKNPAGAEMRQQSALFLEYAKQLGMSFASRARISAKEPEAGGEVNPFA